MWGASFTSKIFRSKFRTARKSRRCIMDSTFAKTSSRSSLKPVPARKSNTRRESSRLSIWVVVKVIDCRRALGIRRQTLRLPAQSSSSGSPVALSASR
jgi:hypothetical protein